MDCTIYCCIFIITNGKNLYTRIPNSEFERMNINVDARMKCFFMYIPTKPNWERIDTAIVIVAKYNHASKYLIPRSSVYEEAKLNLSRDTLRSLFF